MTPTARNYGDVIAGAAEDGDAATAWALYQELIGRGLSPHQETWEALFRTRRPGDQEKLLQVLLYMRDNQIYPQQQLAATIKAWFERWAGPSGPSSPRPLISLCPQSPRATVDRKLDQSHREVIGATSAYGNPSSFASQSDRSNAVF